MKLAALTALASTASASYFSLLAVRSASPIHYGTINANESGIWIGKDAGSYCPPSFAEQNITCPNNGRTVFSGPSVANGSLSLGVSVPGGQQVYIDPQYGIVSFTQPHSANKPEGSVVDGWTFTNGSSFGTLSWSNGILFCSLSGNDSSVGPWQMYAALPQLHFGPACLGASLIASSESGPGAWEYL
ncbi:hypothetical protein PRZ48_011086 [Zasmidium cellare]|uniref:IgE-binding protein n=1 Tax=Zasmidium cellare TaxID=395010 RepID=A0ABR0EBJ9_ZASCE|nr:hypothetical protein PRZ48_011086 [Zasmidium cellare]